MINLKSKRQSRPSSWIEVQTSSSEPKAYDHCRFLRGDMRRQRSEPISYESNHSGKDVMFAQASWKQQPSPQKRLEGRIARNKRKFDDESCDFIWLASDAGSYGNRDYLQTQTHGLKTTSGSFFSSISPASLRLLVSELWKAYSIQEIRWTRLRRPTYEAWRAFHP